MFKTLRDAWNVIDLRKKILFTLFIIVLYRLGSVIPVPYVSPDVTKAAIGYAGNSLLTYFTFIAGESFSNATLFALSISPYITASIVVQLLCVVIPKWQEWQKEDGEEGRRKLDKITRYITVALSLITAFGYFQYLRANGNILFTEAPLIPGNAKLNVWAIGIVMIACYCAGACLIMWLGEKIDNYGIGNGISIILFINILSGIPRMVNTFYIRNLHPSQYSAELADTKPMPMWGFILLAAGVIIFMLAAITFIVHMTEAERRIKISYAKRVQGRKLYGGQDSDLPIKLNMSGVMPIIFAQSIVSIPSTIALLAPGKNYALAASGTKYTFSHWWYDFTNKWFSYTSPIYMIIFFVLIIAFAYFYIAISFDPTEIANNLKKNGGFVLGIRPGAPTANFIKNITNRITLLGALFLSLVAIIPLIINATMANSLGIVAFGGTSILILVGVALETVRELEAQLTTYRRPGSNGSIFRGKRK